MNNKTINKMDKSNERMKNKIVEKSFSSLLINHITSNITAPPHKMYGRNKKNLPKMNRITLIKPIITHDTNHHTPSKTYANNVKGR